MRALNRVLSPVIPLPRQQIAANARAAASLPRQRHVRPRTVATADIAVTTIGCRAAVLHACGQRRNQAECSRDAPRCRFAPVPAGDKRHGQQNTTLTAQPPHAGYRFWSLHNNGTIYHIRHG